MTTAATARVWSAAGGVVLGVLCSHHGFPWRGALACLIVGVVCVTARRGRAVGMAGLVLLAAGLVALRPVVVPPDASRPGGKVAAAYRASLSASLEAAPRRPAGLLAGLTIGDTSGIDYPTIEMFRRSGLAHLVAVSGSNVAMVLAAVAVMTVGLPLFVRGAIGAVGLAAYVAVVGPDPSVLRAAAMGLVGLIAYVSGRQAASLNSLGIAVIVVLAARPDLLFSIGLQLSVAATLGIIVWSRPLEARLHRVPGLARAPMAITLAAQLGVAPLLILAFEQVSLVAPVANLLAAPAVAPATLLGLAAGLIGLLAPGIGELVGRMAAPFAEWILWVSAETGSWSWASVDVSAGWGWVLAVPVALATFLVAVRGPGHPGYLVVDDRMAMGTAR